MSTTNDKLVSEIRALPDVEKLRLVDAILADLDKRWRIRTRRSEAQTTVALKITDMLGEEVLETRLV
jgi:hypothetical protein